MDAQQAHTTVSSSAFLRRKADLQPMPWQTIRACKSRTNRGRLRAAPSTTTIHLSNSQRSATRRLLFGRPGCPYPDFLLPLSRGWSAGRRQGACEAPFTGLRGRCFTPRFRDPSLEGGGGPGARGPFCAKALRLPALHRVRVVGAPAPLRLRTPRSTTPSIERGGMYIYSYRNEVKSAGMRSKPQRTVPPDFVGFRCAQPNLRLLRRSNTLAAQLVAAAFVSAPVAHTHVLVIRAATIGLMRLAEQAAGAGRLRTPSFEMHLHP
jgi:hypothetical protein